MIKQLRALPPRIKILDTRIKSPPKKAAPLYLSQAWRALVAEIIDERGRRCEECGRRDCRIFGDHIVELQDGGAPLDKLNVRLLCGSCHSAKTASARATRIARRH